MNRDTYFEKKRAEQQRNLAGALAIDRAIRPLRNELEKDTPADKLDRNKANFKAFVYYCLTHKSKRK